MFSSKTHWYAVSVCSRREKQCFALLSRKGIEAFLPLQKQLRKWSDRKKEVEMPLFPGYIFVRIDPSRRFEVLSTPGVARFIRFGGEDAIVPEVQIKAIHTALLKPDNIEIVDIIMLPGEEVYISSGPFKGNYARLVRYNGKGKLQLVIEHVNKCFLVEIGRTRVQHIKTADKAIAV
ncbi:MAG: UpxY family transcription antiterminator [Bacteroidales bacterium]|jgi:transcription antitermination factor NusG